MCNDLVFFIIKSIYIFVFLKVRQKKSKVFTLYNLFFYKKRRTTTRPPPGILIFFHCMLLVVYQV